LRGAPPCANVRRHEGLSLQILDFRRSLQIQPELRHRVEITRQSPGRIRRYRPLFANDVVDLGTGTCEAIASALALISSGVRNSSRRISPGKSLACC
jgi:hypothetical protein